MLGTTLHTMHTPRLRLGVSSCLLGNPVRFDSGHKRDPYLIDRIGSSVEWIPVCPELEAGMTIPREAVRLVNTDGGIRMRGSRSDRDWTTDMRSTVERRLDELETLELDGFVVKKDSPSCGMERVRLYAENGIPSRDGVGMFTAELMRRLPLLPVEEEGRLRDSLLRENFLVRLFAYRRLRTMMATRDNWIGALVRFHTQEKLLLLAHHRPSYQSLGRLVAQPHAMPREELLHRYAEGFMLGLKHPAPRPRHTNVLQHMAGYFKNLVDDRDRRELSDTILDFHHGLIPRSAPLTLLRHWIRVHEMEYLARQSYLAPYPLEWIPPTAT